MSRLFDRLCEMAIADEVEIIIGTEVEEATRDGDTSSLAEVLGRAAAVPQLRVLILANGVPPTVRPGPAFRSIDLDELDDASATVALSRALCEHRRSSGTLLQVRGNIIGWHGTVSDSTPSFQNPDRRALLVIDSASMSSYVDAVGRWGLGIAVGSTDAEGQSRVWTMAGAISIIDALVALRVFAFGCDPGNGGAPAVVIDLDERRVQEGVSASAM